MTLIKSQIKIKLKKLIKKNKLFDKINSKRTYLNSKDNCLLNTKFIKLDKLTFYCQFCQKRKNRS